MLNFSFINKDIEIASIIQKIEKIIINQDYNNLISLVSEYKGQISFERPMLMNIEKLKWTRFYKDFEEKTSLIDKRLFETDCKVSQLIQKLENERKKIRITSPDAKLEQNLKSLIEKGGKKLPTQDDIKNNNILFMDPISLKVAISPFVINKYLDNADKIKSFIVALINSFKEDFSKIKALLNMNRLLIDTFPTTNESKSRYELFKKELISFSDLMKERFALALKEENFVRYENWKTTAEIVINDQLKFEEIGSKLKGKTKININLIKSIFFTFNK